MPLYTVEVLGEAREVYEIEASSPEAARLIFEKGDATNPVLTEVYGVWVESVREES